MAPELATNTLGDYTRRHGEDGFYRVMEIQHPSSSREFLDRLYQELNVIIRNLERTSAVRQNDGEDRITLDIVLLLHQAGYNVTHDGYVNGHADISVTQDEFMWIGEAKVHDEYEWLFKGLRQLLNRYATGRADGSGLLIYIKGQNASQVLAEWRQRLVAAGECALKFTEDADSTERLVFWSTHTHASSGLDIKTKHLGVSLYFNPTDQVRGTPPVP